MGEYKNMAKVSIIVPVYMVEKYIAQCIESVLNQTFGDFELILIDDGSKDNSGIICDSYAKKDDRITVIHTDNNGAATADVQCLPTLVEEAAPLVILEAMAEGLPLIVTKSGGVTEYIDDSTALIIEKENVTENMKKAILYMKENPEVRWQMSENGKIQSRKYGEQVYYKDFVKTVYEIEQNNREN